MTCENIYSLCTIPDSGLCEPWQILISCRLGTLSDGSGFGCFILSELKNSDCNTHNQPLAMIYWYPVYYPSLLSIILYLGSIYRNFLKNMQAVSFHCSVFNLIYCAFCNTPWMKHRRLSKPLYTYDDTGFFIRFLN